MRDYADLILTSQTSTRGPIVGHTAQNLDAQQVFINTFENIINRRVDSPEDIQKFQKTLQYARSKVDYVIGASIYMLPSDMNLRIGQIKTYNNKILVSSPSFKIGTNLKINLDGEKDKPDVKPKGEGIVKTKPDTDSNKEHKQDVKPNVEFKKEDKQDIKMIKTKPDTNKITHEEEKIALVLGITSIFTVWWMLK